MLDPRKDLKTKIGISLLIVFALVLISALFITVKSYAQQTETAAASAEMNEYTARVKAFGFLAAALAFGMGTVGAGIAIGNVGSAAMGAVAEKPEIAGQALIFVALAEGLVIFSFITALMILGKV